MGNSLLECAFLYGVVYVVLLLLVLKFYCGVMFVLQSEKVEFVHQQHMCRIL